MAASDPWPLRVSAAALVLVPFALGWGAMLGRRPPGHPHLPASDPLVQAFHAWIGLAFAPVLTVAVASAWLYVFRPGRTEIHDAGRQVLLAAAIVGAGALLMKSVGWHKLPSFVPPEESARAGLVLGFSAGMLEETLFRLVLLPALYAVTSRALPSAPAAASAVGLTALLFALSHEIGPGATGFSAAHFLVRFLVPGCLMGALFFYPGPAFAVSYHVLMHLAIPYLFVE